MEITLEFSAPEKVKADWLIVGVWQDEPLTGAAADLDNKLDGLLSQLVESGDISGKANELTSVVRCASIGAKRILAVGLGEKKKADFRAVAGAAATAARHVTSRQMTSIAMLIPEPAGELSWQDMSAAATVGLSHGCEGPGIRKSHPDRFAPEKITVVAPPSAPKKDIEQAAREARMEALAVSLTRELVNMPPNELYPETFAQTAEEIAQDFGIECTIFDGHQLAKENMGALLGVAQGSERPPRLVVLRYNGKPGGKTLGLVGKGVTFDSGGLSLKSSENMLDMKCDMAGAATVLGALQAIAEMKLPVNVVGVLALVENMPSGKALKLGDVLVARNSKTIEIHNTDAEGRLILADALAYAVEQKVDNLVDLATLTGACMVALGTEVVGLMSNNESWAGAVQQASRRAGELVWPLPMFPLYGEMIKSKVADIKNTGGKRWAGAISAAKFLEEFVGDVPWVHLDIAGPAFAEDDTAQRAAGATGVMVRTLVELARRYGQA